MAPRKKKEGPKEPPTEQFSAKMGLKKLKINDEYLKEMKKDVKDMSEIQVLFSIVIEYGIRKPKSPLLDWIVYGPKKYKDEQFKEEHKQSRIVENQKFKDDPLAQYLEQEAKKDEPKVKQDYYGPRFDSLMRAFDEKTRTEPFMRELIEELNITERYNLDLRANMVKQCASSFDTIFKNNIVEPAESRIKDYFIKCLGDDEDGHKQVRKATELMKRLFDCKNGQPRDNEMNSIFNGGAYKHLDFNQFTRRWWEFVPFFLELERVMPTFPISPYIKPGIKHVYYTNTVMLDFLKRVDKVNWPGPIGEYTKDNGARMNIWEKVINIPRKWRNSFDNAINTDGVAVTLTCKRRKRPKVDEKKENEEKKKILNSNDFDRHIGCDPGKKLIVSGAAKKEIVVDSPGQQFKEERIRMGATSFHQESGYYKRKMKRKKITGPYQRQLRQILNEYRTEVPPKEPGGLPTLQELNLKDPDKFKQAAEYKLRFFHLMQPVYSRRKLVRMKFDKYIGRQRAVDKMANELIYGRGKGKTEGKLKTLVVVGQYKMTGLKPKGKNISAPIAKILNAVKKSEDAELIVVDEWRTTMLCSRCNLECHVSRLPDRYVNCKNCHIVWNRDVNAGRSILHFGWIECGWIEKRELPVFDNFSRSRKRKDLITRSRVGRQPKIRWE